MSKQQFTEHVWWVGGIPTSPDGETDHAFYVVYASNEEQAMERLREAGIVATHCQHDYDCCGHRYTSAPQIIYHDDIYHYFVARQSGHLNI